MQLSKEIKAQAERYEKKGAFSLSHPQKVELSNLHKELFGGGVNTSCATCVAKALSLVYNKLKEKEELVEAVTEHVTKEDERPPIVIHSEEANKKQEETIEAIKEDFVKQFKGVKEYTLKELKPLKIADLKKIAEEVGVEVIGKQSKTQIIKSIINR